MINKDLIKYSLGNLWKRRLRSSLTILSVLIGIAAITTLISFGNGISTYVEQISQEMGDDKLLIEPRGSGFGVQLESNVILDDSDVNAVEKTNGIEEATGMYVSGGEAEFDDQKKFVFLMGIDYKNYGQLVRELFTLDIEEGQELRGDEKTKVILGYNYKLEDKIFDKPIKLRDKIKVNGVKMDVAGFYEEVGNPQDDSNIYVTKDAMEEIFGAASYQYIIARTAPGRDPLKVVDDVKEELRDHRHQRAGREDFFVQTFDQAIETFSSILSIITTVVILIALISLVVAAVNITNTMYTSILERTKEIGVMKAIGARNKEIISIFIMESGILSLVGGIIGAAIGYLISTFAGNIIAAAGYSSFRPLFTWNLVLWTLIFAFMMGLVGGIMPAIRASKLKPVDALRYE